MQSDPESAPELPAEPRRDVLGRPDVVPKFSLKVNRRETAFIGVPRNVTVARL